MPVEVNGHPVKAFVDRDDGVGTISVLLINTFEFPNSNSYDGWLMALPPPEDVFCVSGVEVTTTWAPGVVTEVWRG